MNTLKLTEIVPDKNQPRKYFGVEKMASLKDSVKKHGIITPIVVQKEGDKYLIVDGERRYRTAKDLNLKEIPVQIISPKNAFVRLLEQFHIQEQHESWSATEKALAIIEISDVAKKSLSEVCELLSIDKRAFRYYQAFALLQNKDKYLDSNVNLKNAEKIIEVKNFARRTKENLNKPWTRADADKLEKVLIQKIKDKEIQERSDYSRIKDSFRRDPKLIDKFMNEEYDINRQFIESKARSAYYARNVVTNCNYVAANGSGFLRDPNVKLTGTDILALKRCRKVCDDIIKLTE